MDKGFDILRGNNIILSAFSSVALRAMIM